MKDKIDALAALSVPALAARYREVFQAEPPALHRQFLFRKLAWQLQADKEGGLSREARELAAAIACDAPLRVRVINNAARLRAGQALDRTASATVEPGHDSRLPMPGGVIQREYRGDLIRVEVKDDGFTYNGRRYTSLSAIAFEVTKTKWNGFLFFGLTQEKPHARH
jgi:hypothetical protein